MYGLAGGAMEIDAVQFDASTNQAIIGVAKECARAVSARAARSTCDDDSLRDVSGLRRQAAGTVPPCTRSSRPPSQPKLGQQLLREPVTDHNYFTFVTGTRTSSGPQPPS